MFAQGFPPSVPMQNAPAARSLPQQPYARPPDIGTRPQPATRWEPALAQQPLPPSRVRAQAADEPAVRPRPQRAAVAILSPEELGVSAAARPVDRPAVDWTAVHGRLDRLGAT